MQSNVILVHGALASAFPFCVYTDGSVLVHLTLQELDYSRLGELNYLSWVLSSVIY